MWSSGGEDKRPMSVQHLERTCSQLQSIVEDQERAIKLLEKSLKDAVTKNHIEIVLAGKMTQQEIEAMMNDVTKEIEASLGKKVDFAQADALLNTKASMSSIEALRTEMNLLRDSIRNGEGIGRMKGIDGNGSNQANPFDHYQHELSSMLQQLKDEQKKLKDEKEKQREARLAEENVSRSNTLDGANHVGRGQFDLSEKKELHDRISRLELAIQLAHAQAQSAGMDKSSLSRGGSRRSKGGPNDGHGDDSVISEQLSKLLDTRASKLRRELDDLRQRNRQVEVDTQKFQRQIDSMREGKGGSSSYGLGGDQHSKDLSQLFRELDRLESNYDALTGGSGQASGKGIQSDREWVDSILLPQSNQMSIELTEIRNMLRDQSRAHRRLLDSLTDAKTSVTADINDLYQQVQLLRRRLKAHTEEFTQDLLHGLHDQQQLYGEFQSFRSMIETALYQMSQHLDDNSSTLTAIQQPLYDQIRITSTHQAHIRTSTLETKYAEEYARLRQRYEEMRERIERHQKETRAHDQLSEESSQTYDIYHNINEVFQSDENEQKMNPASSSPSTPLGYFRIASPLPPPQSNFSLSPLPSSSPSSYRSVARAASAGIRPRISASISTPQSPTPSTPRAHSRIPSRPSTSHGTTPSTPNSRYQQHHQHQQLMSARTPQHMAPISNRMNSSRVSSPHSHPTSSRPISALLYSRVDNWTTNSPTDVSGSFELLRQRLSIPISQAPTPKRHTINLSSNPSSPSPPATVDDAYNRPDSVASQLSTHSPSIGSKSRLSRITTTVSGMARR